MKKRMNFTNVMKMNVAALFVFLLLLLSAAGSPTQTLGTVAISAGRGRGGGGRSFGFGGSSGGSVGNGRSFGRTLPLGKAGTGSSHSEKNNGHSSNASTFTPLNTFLFSQFLSILVTLLNNASAYHFV